VGEVGVPLPADRLTSLAGWAENTRAVSYAYRPTTINGIREVFALARERSLHIGLRGAGRSYGDASLAGEHLTLDLTRMNRILDWNPETGVMTVEPGVTVRQMWEYAIEDGWWPHVVPGTMFPTLGGVAAMNIHGKNHWHAGTIGEHIREFDLLLPSGEAVTCRPDNENAELFHAAVGGFGMLGVMTRLTVELRRVHSGLLRVKRYSARNLAEMFVLTEAHVENADYLVGWIDGFAYGESLGRGLIDTAQHLAPGEDPAPHRTLTVAAQELPDTILGLVPKSILWRFMKPVLNNAGMRFLNRVQYTLGSRAAGKAFYEPHAAFAFRLDYVPNWKRAYGRYGLMQYQVFVPKEDAEAVFRKQLLLCQQRGLPPYLAVFKRHRPDPFLMSYGGDGYSLALDFKITADNRERLWKLAAEMDPIVLDAGGRFYFAKDSTLHPARLSTFLKEERVQRFLTLKRQYDPENLLQTDLYRRLFSEAVRVTRDSRAEPVPMPEEP
jgi:FAD/FMN-containing dehydrogenase